MSGDVLLEAGEQVQLRGQKSKSDSESRRLRKLVKELGSCGDAKTTADANTAKTGHASN